MKKIIGFIATVVCVALLVVNFTVNSNETIALKNVEVLLNDAEANGNPYCENDKGDSCGVYGTKIKNCDESQTNGCKADQNPGFDPIN